MSSAGKQQSMCVPYLGERTSNEEKVEILFNKARSRSGNIQFIG